MGKDKKKEEKKKEEKPTKEHMELEEKHKKLKASFEKSEKELAKLKKEEEALKKEKEAKAAPAVAAKGTNIKGLTFQAVVTGEQLGKLTQRDDIGVVNINGDNTIVEDRENIVILTVPAEKVPEIIDIIGCPPTIARGKKAEPDAPPPPAEKAPPKVEEELDEDGNPVEKIDPELPKVPEPTFKANSDIDFAVDDWEGQVPLTFTWVDQSSPFSEFNDPGGRNWSCFTHTMSAPGTPEKVSLEWRQGMRGEWHEIPATDKSPFVAEMTVAPERKEKEGKKEAVSGSDYRGFQSRWVIDGEKYLSPLQLAPTLISKLMTYPAVRGAIKALPADKQEIKNIENETLRDILLTVENIVPMNTWDVDYGVTKMPGAYLKGEHTVTLSEKLEMIAKLKSADPKLQSEMRKTILKSPIMAASTAAKQVKIKIDMLVGGLDFFLPKMTEPDFDAMRSNEEKTLLWEAQRREMQIDINEKYPTYQAGVRVTFPPAGVIQNAMKTKRPLAGTVSLPVNLVYKLEDKTLYIEKHEFKFVYWKDGADHDKEKVEVVLDTPEAKTEKFMEGMSLVDKEVWKKYTKQIHLEQGVYRYYWTYDGKPFFNNGSAFGDEFKAGETYLTFSVFCHVQFGIGVQM